MLNKNALCTCSPERYPAFLSLSPSLLPTLFLGLSRLKIKSSRRNVYLFVDQDCFYSLRSISLSFYCSAIWFCTWIVKVKGSDLLTTVGTENYREHRNVFRNGFYYL